MFIDCCRGCFVFQLCARSCWENKVTLIRNSGIMKSVILNTLQCRLLPIDIECDKDKINILHAILFCHIGVHACNQGVTSVSSVAHIHHELAKRTMQENKKIIFLSACNWTHSVFSTEADFLLKLLQFLLSKGKQLSNFPRPFPKLS